MRKFYDTYLDGSSKGSLPKPYFAKYLPVEGEIKEGDMVKTMGETMQPYYEGKMLSNKRAYQLYKLFLCSRDIQVGDTFKHALYIEQNYLAKEVLDDKIKTPNYPLDCYPIPNPHLFKVIGEISPEATWVTENMEFSQEDIDIYDVSHLPVNICHIRCPVCKTLH